MTIFLALFIRSNSAAASLLTAVPPLPGPPPVPLFLLRSELKKLAKTPSLAAPPGPGLPPSTYRYKNTEHTLKPVAHPGGRAGGPPPPYFLTKLRPEGPKKFFGRPAPHPLTSRSGSGTENRYVWISKLKVIHVMSYVRLLLGELDVFLSRRLCHCLV